MCEVGKWNLKYFSYDINFVPQIVKSYLHKSEFEKKVKQCQLAEKNSRCSDGSAVKQRKVAGCS